MFENKDNQEFFIRDLIQEKSDPLTHAVKELFGLSYLFPYQRLVVANILEAAKAAATSPSDFERNLSFY